MPVDKSNLFMPLKSYLYPHCPHSQNTLPHNDITVPIKNKKARKMRAFLERYLRRLISLDFASKLPDEISCSILSTKTK